MLAVYSIEDTHLTLAFFSFSLIITHIWYFMYYHGHVTCCKGIFNLGMGSHCTHQQGIKLGLRLTEGIFDNNAKSCHVVIALSFGLTVFVTEPSLQKHSQAQHVNIM